MEINCIDAEKEVKGVSLACEAGGLVGARDKVLWRYCGRCPLIKASGEAAKTLFRASRILTGNLKIYDSDGRRKRHFKV